MFIQIGQMGLTGNKVNICHFLRMVFLQTETSDRTISDEILIVEGYGPLCIKHWCSVPSINIVIRGNECIDSAANAVPTPQLFLVKCH